MGSHFGTEAKANLTYRYEALDVHYGTTPTHTNRGISYQDGAIESAHGHLESTVRDAVLLRGITTFPDLKAYRRFIAEIIGSGNRSYHDLWRTEELTTQVKAVAGDRSQHDLLFRAAA